MFFRSSTNNLDTKPNTRNSHSEVKGCNLVVDKRHGPKMFNGFTENSKKTPLKISQDEQRIYYEKNMMRSRIVYTSSAIWTGRWDLTRRHRCYRDLMSPLPPLIKSLVLISVTLRVSAAGRIRSINNASDQIGNRTRIHPPCSAVFQPTAPPRTL